MNEQQFTELLKKLKIPTNNRSYADIFDLLDAKLSEYLDRQDEASQALVDDIQDALDYAEIKKNEVGSGIALKREEEPKSEDKADISELRDATEKAHREKAQVDGINGQAVPQGQPAAQQPQAQGQNVAGQQAGKLWFSSVNGADNINTMFFQALDDLKYGEFDHAKSIFEAILQVEPNNASAYLGKLMAIHQIKELRGIGNSYDKDLFSDINMRRAYDHGNDQQKKYLDDAKKEVESGKKYKEADRKAQDISNESAQMEAAQMFTSLGAYRDAAQRKEQCVERIKEIKYNNALAINKRAYTASDYRKAAALYREVAGYKNADNLAKDCEEFAKRRDEEEAEDKRKNDLKAAFLKLKNDFGEEEKTQRYRCDDKNTTIYEPSTEELTRRLEAMKRFVAENPEANIVADAQTHIAAAEASISEIDNRIKEFQKLNAVRKSEGKWDRFWIAVMVVLMLVVGVPADGHEVRHLSTFFPIFLVTENSHTNQMYVREAMSPYLISLAELETLELSASDNIKVLVMPKAKLSTVILTNGDYGHLKWPDTVKEMSLYNVSGVNIPESVETLHLSGSIENVTIPSSVREVISHE